MNVQDQTPGDLVSVCFAHGVSSVRASGHRGAARVPGALWTPPSWWAAGWGYCHSCWSEPREKTREGFFSPGAWLTTSMDTGRRCFLLALGVPAPDGQLCSLSRNLFWALAGHEGLRPSDGSLDVFSL